MPPPDECYHARTQQNARAGDAGRVRGAAATRVAPGAGDSTSSAVATYGRTRVRPVAGCNGG